MNTSPQRILSVLVLVLAFALNARAQVLLSIDWSDLSAVKITAESNAPAFSYNNSGDLPEYGGGASSFQGEDGVTFENFLTSPHSSFGDVGPLASSSTLMDYSTDSTFDQLYILNNISQGGSLKDLNIYAATTSGYFIFANGQPAFTGEAVFDLSDSQYTSLINRFPGLGATGSIVMWNTFAYPLGTWQVTGAAIPEPSTYAALFGGLALMGAIVRRRSRSRS